MPSVLWRPARSHWGGTRGIISKTRLIECLPALSSVLIEFCNVGQLWRMWTRHTAAGQNPWSYGSLLVSLILWLIYYRVRIGKGTAYWVTLISAVMVAAILVSIIILNHLNQ